MNSCLESFSSGIKVKPINRVIDWADLELFIKEGIRYDSRKTPYVIEIGIAASYDSPTQLITIVKGQQLGLTELLKAIVGQIMSENPDNIIYILPTISTSIQFSKAKLQKMIEATPSLSAIVSDASSRDGTNTTLMKEFPGGFLYIATANSGSELRMKDARVVIVDEYDGTKDDIDGEGSLKDVAAGRTAAKGSAAKIILNSTPVEMDKSKIWPEFLEGSQEYYYVPCPFCKFEQIIKWENFKYNEKDVTSIRLQCVNDKCKQLIPENYKTWMMNPDNGAKYIAHNPDRQNKLHRSFHISSLYSPLGFLSWSQILQKFLDIKGNKTKLIAFYNLVLGIPYQDTEEELTPVSELKDRRYKFNIKISDFIRNKFPTYFDERGELYDDRVIVPKDCIYLTAGTDTQDKWIETYVVGWGLNRNWWLIDHFRVDAPDGRRVDHQYIWDEQEAFRNKIYIHETGVEMKVSVFFHDTGGHYADSVYNFVRGKYAEGYIATKGSNVYGSPLISPMSRNNKGKIPLHMIGTDTAKRTIFGRFKAKKPGEDGYFHLPDWCTDEMCEQFLSEKLCRKKTKNAKGQILSRQHYEKTRDRNEGLDCLVGAYSAMKFRPINWVSLYSIYNGDNFTNTSEKAEEVEKKDEKEDEIIVLIDDTAENNNDNTEIESEVVANEQQEARNNIKEPEKTDYTQFMRQERRGQQNRPQPQRQRQQRIRKGWWG